MTFSPISDIDFTLHPASSPLPAAERDALLADPGFGTVFTDHMVTIRWSQQAGWHDARLEPYGPLSLDPATSVLHYAQEIFEGLKAYRQVSGQIVAFRPEANAARFNRSAARMAMPQLPETAFVRAIDLLVGQDHAWVPSSQSQSLYLRPFMIATDPCLGVNHASLSFLFMVIASPAGGYFGGSLRPVSVWLAQDYTRAAIGGTGAVKAGGNYGGGFAAQQQANENGCDQVVWLDPGEHRFVEEMGGMNLFFVHGSGPGAKVVTPGLTGSLLPGITRDSLLRIAPDLGIGAEEGRISVADWQAGAQAGEITEVFACGTAAVVTPVGMVKGESGSWTIGDGVTPGPVTMQLRDHLLGIQFGQIPDPYGWIHKIL
ncbi:MAG TPA: branched-chain amino acid aminotransferase [Streptosporangiaceae bacterium]|jgi:branched-chain amino acid aminotransferase